MDRAALINAFRRTDPVSRACISALSGGADFEVFDNTTDVASVVTIYTRRAEHVAAIGLEHGGFDQALSDLTARSTEDVRLGQITDSAGHRHYQLFLAPDADEVIACLWVHHEA